MELPVKFCSIGYHRLTSCRWGGSQAVRFSKEGAIDLVIRFPTAYSITACCFGGKNDLMRHVHPFDYIIMQVQIIINCSWLRHTVGRMEVIQVCRKSTLTPATFFVLIWVQGSSKGVLDIGSSVRYSGTRVVQAILYRFFAHSMSSGGRVMKYIILIRHESVSHLIEASRGFRAVHDLWI